MSTSTKKAAKRTAKSPIRLKYDPKNARKHGDQNKSLIRASLEEVGAFRSIAVDGDGIVRAGNGVLEQAEALGLQIVPVEVKPNQLVAVIRPDLKGRKAERAALLDNRAGELSDWDMDVLAELAATDRAMLEGLFSDNDIKAFASLQDAIQASEAKADVDLTEVALELQKKWKTEAGQTWVIPSITNPDLVHRLHIGDSTTIEAWMAVTDGRQYNTLVTSPPYAEQRKTKYGGIPTDQYVSWWMTGIDPLASKFIRDDGNIFVNIKGHTEKGQRVTYTYELVLALKQAGWQFIDELCWVKTAYPGDMGKRFRNGFEPIYWFSRDDSRKFRLENVLMQKQSDFTGYSENLAVMQGTTGTKKTQALSSVRPSNVLTIVSDQTPNSQTGGHPARYPPKLVEFCMLATTDFGDLVIDPFAGSGTTLVVCEQAGRACGAIERLPEYGAAILERASLNGLSPRPEKKNSSR